MSHAAVVLYLILEFHHKNTPTLNKDGFLWPKLKPYGALVSSGYDGRIIAILREVVSSACLYVHVTTHCQEIYDTDTATMFLISANPITNIRFQFQIRPFPQIRSHCFTVSHFYPSYSQYRHCSGHLASLITVLSKLEQSTQDHPLYQLCAAATSRFIFTALL